MLPIETNNIVNQAEIDNYKYHSQAIKAVEITEASIPRVLNFWPINSITSYMVNTVNSVISNRLGLANKANAVLIQTQDIKFFQKKLQVVAGAKNTEIIEIPYKNTTLKAIIHYPVDYDQLNDNECIVFSCHNAEIALDSFSAICEDDSFDNKQKIAISFGEKPQPNPHKHVISLRDTAEELQKIIKCPVILYDYIGTGINKNSTLQEASAKTLIDSGEVVINYALENFQKVNVCGTYLGAAVETVALAKLFQKQQIDSTKVKLLNIDCFTTTARVILPSYPNFADFWGKFLKVHIDAEAAAKELINQQNVNLVCFRHIYDPIIPQNSQLYKAIEVDNQLNNFTSEYDPSDYRSGSVVKDKYLKKCIEYFDKL